MSIRKTIWEYVRDYFRSIRKGGIVLRSDYMEEVSALFFETRMDEYRCILMKAGYLKTYKRGVYEKVKQIPKTLTYRQARREAYDN